MYSFCFLFLIYLLFDKFVLFKVWYLIWYVYLNCECFVYYKLVWDKFLELVIMVVILVIIEYKIVIFWYYLGLWSFSRMIQSDYYVVFYIV